MSNIRFTIKSVKPDDQDFRGIVRPIDDLIKVIQDCHLDAEYFIAEADEEHLQILELAKRYPIDDNNITDLSDRINCLEDADKEHIKILTRIAKESNINDVDLASKMVKPLVRVLLPMVSLSIEPDWKLNNGEQKLLERTGRGYGDLLNY